MASSIRFDLPTPDGDTKEFWDAARRGQLLVKRCATCGRAHYYPRPFCPFCWSRHVGWEEASGNATLYTYSIVYRNDLPPFAERVPYVAAIVDLQEGPRAMSNVVDTEFDALKIGMPLRVKFQPISDEFTIPVFRAV